MSSQKKFSSLLIGILCLLTACGTRSISNSGYHADSDHSYNHWDYNHHDKNPFYKGELNEFEVIGINPKSVITEAEIAQATAVKSPISFPKGSTVMLIQSGAIIPDEQMVKGMEKYYNTSVFSGVPMTGFDSPESYSRALRLAAAKGGAKNLLVYWGLLETGTQDLATKAISWFPFIGSSIPDEKQLMRIRMKVAVVDVKTGQWEMFSPEPFDDSSSSSDHSRISSDQAQVAILKNKSYQSVVEDVVKRYAK